MRNNKKFMRAMITILVVALTGYEIQNTLARLLNIDVKGRPDIIRNFRIGRRINNGRRWDGLAWDDDELDIELEC